MLKNPLWIVTIFALVLTGALYAPASLPPNFETALTTQQELAVTRSHDPKVFNDLGNLLLLAGRTDEAEEAYRRAVELAPEDPVPHYNLALLLQEVGRRKQALGEFKEVLRLAPDNAWALYQMGAIYEAFGDREEAIRAYAKAFGLNPLLASAKENPQVIESNLIYEAMLRGYRNAGRGSLAPKAYDDPSRIARLLVSMPDADEEDAEEMGLASTGEDSSSGPGVPLESAAGDFEQEGMDPEDRGEGSSRQVLTPDSIERGGSLGQVTTGGQNRANPQPRTIPRTIPRTTNDGRGFRPPGAQTSAPPETRPGRIRVRPDLRSTGSLELELRSPSEATGRIPAALPT